MKFSAITKQESLKRNTKVDSLQLLNKLIQDLRQMSLTDEGSKIFPLEQEGKKGLEKKEKKEKKSESKTGHSHEMVSELSKHGGKKILSTMYTRLTITVDEEEVIFQAHEIIKIAQDLIEKRRRAISNPFPRRIINNSSHDYLEQFKNFSQDILRRYENKYGLENGSLKQFLDKMYFAVLEAPSLIVPYFMGHQELLKYVKKCKEMTPKFQGFTSKEITREFLPVPRPIQNIDRIEKWLALPNELSLLSVSNATKGWWVLLAGRLIHVNYAPETSEGLDKAQHFYVSDHGQLDDVYNQVKQVTLFHSLADGDWNWAVHQFYEFYKTLNEVKQDKLRENFINSVGAYDTDDDKSMQILLISFGYDQEIRPEILKSQSLKYPTMVGIPMLHTRNLIDEPTHYMKKGVEYNRYKAIYEITLERIKYQAEVRITSYYKKILFRGVYNTFKTQLSNVMSEQDAEIYMECELLSHLRQEIDHGDRHVLFRSYGSYGNKDKGDSYHDFEKAFACYLKESEASEADLAQVMRRVLKGDTQNVTDCSFIPNLAGAWFIAEASRNLLSILSGLMILDMIENNIELGDEKEYNWYSWRNVLIHPLKGTMYEKDAYDLYGSKIKNIDRFGGAHPMAHCGSVADAQVEVKPNAKLTPVRQKEASLIFHWLEQYWKQEGVLFRLSSNEESRLSHVDASFDELCDGDNDSPRLQWLRKQISKRERTIGEKKKNIPDANTTKEEQEIAKFILERNKLIAKQKVQREFIIPGLENRLSSLDNLLALKQEKELSGFEALGEKREHLQLKEKNRLLNGSVLGLSVPEQIPGSSASLSSSSTERSSNVLGLTNILSSVVQPSIKALISEQIEKRLIDQYSLYFNKFGTPPSDMNLKIKFNKAIYRQEDLKSYMVQKLGLTPNLKEDESNVYVVIPITKLLELSEKAKTSPTRSLQHVI